MRSVRVSLNERSYLIKIGGGLLAQLGCQCRRLDLGGKCAIITDTHVAALYAKEAVTSLRSAGFEPTLIVVPAGETAKTLGQARVCLEALARQRIERSSFIVALGGGVVGDLAGFVAATYLRGVAFVQVPTTLLAQVDSSVGGKVGVNLKSGKNLVGAFYQPRLVLCDLDSLATLTPREFRAGLAEVIKYGMIADAALFRRLERRLPQVLAREPALLADVVARCCQLKARVVAQDETESGPRAILNFGHTVGHALEAVAGYGALLHGEAVAIGQVAAARLSRTQRGLPPADAARLKALLARAGLPVSIALTPRKRARVWEAMQRDKKVSRGLIKFVLTPRIGRAIWGQAVSDEVIAQTLSELGDVVDTPAQTTA